MQANTAHQLAEVHEALNNSTEANGMRQEVQAKVKDVREVADDNLAKAAAKSAQAQAKVEELKAQLLAHWQQADRLVNAALSGTDNLMRLDLAIVSWRCDSIVGRSIGQVLGIAVLAVIQDA